MAIDLTGKTILFFGPNFFGYENHIIAEMKRCGATVYFHSDKPKRNTLFKIMLRLFPKLVWPYADWYYARWLDAQAITQCDLIFVIKGEGTSPKFLYRLQERFPKARRIYYMWDSIANMKFTEDRIPLFDKVLSFDPRDCAAHPNLIYRANFFLDSFAPKSAGRGRGMFFIGTLNGDRPRVLAKLLTHLKNRIAVNYTLYVRSQIELTLRLWTDESFKIIGQDHLVSKPIRPEVIAERMAECAVVLDIEHPNQAGLTMRTFDALAAGKKLVTTNRSIQAHDFYDDSRICVLDRNDPIIPDAFLLTEGRPMPVFFYEKYSVAGWLNEIFAV